MLVNKNMKIKKIIAKKTNQIKESSYKTSSDFLIEKTSDKNFKLNNSFKISKDKNLEYVLIVDKDLSQEVKRSFVLENGANLNSYRLFLNSKEESKFKFEHEIKEGAKIDSRSLVIGLNEEKFSLKADYNFSGRNSFGRIQVNALLLKRAKLYSASDVNILPSAQKSDTRVDMTLRLEGKEAKGEVIPGLNIAANDVKAGHSAGTFRLKLEDLFYLRSRGLSLDKIRRLFVLALANNFVESLKNKNIKEELLKIIREKI